MLIPLSFPPGVYGQGTKYQSKARWLTAQLVRFTEGVKKPVGGWTALATTGATIVGVARALLGWAVQGVLSPYLAVGTNSHIYTFTAGALVDRTPPDLVTGLVDTTYSLGAYGTGNYGAGPYGTGDATQGTTTPAATWQLDTFGSFLVGVLSSDGRLLYWDANTATEFFVPVTGSRAESSLTVTVNPTDTETVVLNGKTYTFQTSLTNVDGHVKIAATLALTLANLVYAVNLSGGVVGTDYATATTVHPTIYARLFTGTIVKVYSKAWGVAGNALTTTETLANGAFTGATLAAGVSETSPVNNTACFVTAERYLVALGANGDPRAIAWADAETLTDWTPSATNTAGDLPLPGSGKLVCGRRSKSESLIWTTEGLFALRYIGGTLVYSLEEVGSKCGIIGPNACAVIDSRAVWMGPKGFFVYDGFVQPVPSEISYAVFSDMNVAQQVKCYTKTFAELSEVHFHYPSAGSTECDKYVIWNYRENHWTPGSLTRSAGIDRGAFDYPLMVSGATIYEHEKGTDHTGAATPFLESGPLELGDGDNVMSITQIIPDEATLSGQVLGSTAMMLYAAMYPTSTETAYGPYTMANPTGARVTGRQVRVRISEVTPGNWVVGVVRLDAIPGGQR